MFLIKIKYEILKYGAKIGEMGYWINRIFYPSPDLPGHASMHCQILVLLN